MCLHTQTGTHSTAFVAPTHSAATTHVKPTYRQVLLSLPVFTAKQVHALAHSSQAPSQSRILQILAKALSLIPVLEPGPLFSHQLRCSDAGLLLLTSPSSWKMLMNSTYSHALRIKFTGKNKHMRVSACWHINLGPCDPLPFSSCWHPDLLAPMTCSPTLYVLAL